MSSLDAFPSEFLYHLAPLLHVGGLDEEAEGSPFNELVTSLRKAFTSKNEFRAYNSSRGASADFHVVLVDKHARFPVRKGSGAGAGHSPLSPLSPASPLHPDGLMAPIWIKKHRELLPAAFVLALRLWDPSLDEGVDPVDPLSPVAGGQKESKEGQRDVELISEIMDRKKQTAERGIKLAVILLTSRKMLDDPGLDLRLSIIRRQSGLDTRASLFVISPVAVNEVTNFVASLRGELYESAVDYYREHGRRARRKRSRVPTHVSRPIGQTSGPAPLGPQAWSVRYDYKMAVFAELRQEIEVAIKHYEDCYEGLVDLFGSTTALPPRTKRWLEAKVLADCTNAKICKLYMYTEEPERVLAQHNKHVARFRTLCNGWQIGEDTFEYWSWLSKQHRLFADLLDLGIRSGFRLPVHRPPVPSKTGPPPAPGINPSTALLHPGFYYYLAAQCASERKVRFKAMEAADADSGSEVKTVSRALEHEKQVKHDEQIIELYTKAYDFFKRFHAGRFSLSMAAAIAGVHVEAENHSVALRFFERIAKTYRKEDWRSILESILHQAYVAARKQQDVPAAAKLAIELLAHGPASPDYAIEVERGLSPILAALPAPEDAATIVLDEPACKPLLDVHLGFWVATARLGESVPFQLVLTAQNNMAAAEISFASLRIDLGENRPTFTVRHSASSAPAVGIVALDEINEVEADLSWKAGGRRVFSGTVVLDKPGSVQLSQIVLQLEDNGWKVEIPLKSELQLDAEDEPLPQPWHLIENDRLVSLPERSWPIVHFVPRTLRVESSVDAKSPAYLGELFPVSIKVDNKDELPVNVVCDLLVQPAESDIDVSTLYVDGEAVASSSHRLELGTVAAGQTVEKVVHVRCEGGPSARLLDISITAQPADREADAEAILPAANESLHSLAFDAVHPFTCDFSTNLLHSGSRRAVVRAVGDLTRPDGWEDAVDFAVSAQLGSPGQWPIDVVEVIMQLENVAQRIRLVEATLDAADLPIDLQPGDAYGLSYRLQVAREAATEHTGHLEIRWRRSAEPDTPLSSALIPLPMLLPPISVPRVTVSLPPYAVQHEPTTLVYAIFNPSLTRPLKASVQVEGGEPWAFSGPRRTAPFLVLPGQRHVFRITAIATHGAGDVALPLVRVLEILPPVPVEPGAETDEPPPVRAREMPILVEGSSSVRPTTIFVVPKGTTVYE